MTSTFDLILFSLFMASSVMSQCHIYCNMPCTMTSSSRGKQPMGIHMGESITGHRNNSSQSAQAKRPVTMVNSLGSKMCIYGKCPVLFPYAPCVHRQAGCINSFLWEGICMRWTQSHHRTYNNEHLSTYHMCSIHVLDEPFLQLLNVLIHVHIYTHTFFPAVVTYSSGNYSS